MCHIIMCHPSPGAPLSNSLTYSGLPVFNHCVPWYRGIPLVLLTYELQCSNTSRTTGFASVSSILRKWCLDPPAPILLTITSPPGLWCTPHSQSRFRHPSAFANFWTAARAGDAHGHGPPCITFYERTLLSAWQKQGRDWLMLRGKADLVL